MTVLSGLYGATPKPLITDASGNLLITFSSQFSDAVSFTRTADVNAYTAGDVVGTATGSTAALTFTPMGAADQVVEITNSIFTIGAASVPAGMTSFTLHLYSITPPSALGDNAPWDLPAGDVASYMGSFSLGTPADIGSSLFIQNLAVSKQVRLATTSLFAYLVTDGGYTPASATQFDITLYAKAL